VEKIDILIFKLEYKPNSENALFDICDFNGRVLKTGTINPSGETEIDLSGIASGTFMIYILDGANIERRKITI
jgi:hypothetical protein